MGTLFPNNIDLPLKEELHSSANGLLFLGGHLPHPLILCNPITREYITLPSPRRPSSKFMSWHAEFETYGFGMSRTSREYKLVRIFYENKPPFGCQVFTVGTGSWRKIATAKLTFLEDTKGVFLNGNLHWLAKKGTSRRVSCLDLETELFRSFSLPPLDRVLKYNKDVSVLGDCLCVCNITVDRMADYFIEIWLMKEYGDEESSTKELAIREVFFPENFVDDVFAIKVFEDGDILMQWGGIWMLHYSSKTKRTHYVRLSVTRRKVSCCASPYAPSFLPLETSQWRM